MATKLATQGIVQTGQLWELALHLTTTQSARKILCVAERAVVSTLVPMARKLMYNQSKATDKSMNTMTTNFKD